MMQKIVFLSGSRTISRLNDVIRTQIQEIINKKSRVVVGDANGADKAMQSYLAEKGYRHVAVFCADGKCRNNVGEWSIENITTNPKLRGRALYTKRDEAMAAKADFGLVLWDGKSEGSINNVFELLKNGKRSDLYFAPQKKFIRIETADDIEELLQGCEAKSFRRFDESKHLRHQMENLSIGKQGRFDL